LNGDREFERRIEAALLHPHFDMMDFAIPNFVWWLEAQDVVIRPPLLAPGPSANAAEFIVP
jgi:hypothetical protein